MTPEQLAKLKAAILADPVLSQLPNNYDTAYKIEAWANAFTADFYVWRTSVSADEWADAIIGGGGATQLDALTGSKRESLLWACDRSLNPSRATVRAALDDFCGSQNTLKAAIQAAQKRLARMIEKICATGTGSLAEPATMDYQGTITVYDAKQALDLP